MKVRIRKDPSASDRGRYLVEEKRWYQFFWMPIKSFETKEKALDFALQWLTPEIMEVKK